MSQALTIGAVAAPPDPPGGLRGVDLAGSSGTALRPNADTARSRAYAHRMLFSNIDDGYLEGLLRGYRGGILTSGDYANLCQCETIDGTPPPRPCRLCETQSLTLSR